jgi:RNA polymerase sigma-70 factor (ECF subfamily)
MSVEEAIEECVRSHYRRLVAAVGIVTGSQALAEEAVQDAFARALEQSRKGASFDNVAAWVVTVALNNARTGRRRAAAERRAVGRLAARSDGQSEPVRAELAHVVRSALDGLARRQRDAVVLFYFLDLDVASVAASLGVSEGTVKTALSRARARLAVLLENAEMETE